MHRRLIPLLIFATAVTPLFAQSLFAQRLDEEEKLERVTFIAGLYAAYAHNFHYTTSDIFTGGADCGGFGNGTGGGYALNAFFELPLIDDLIYLHGAVGYLQRGGAFGETVTGGLPILDPNTDEYTTLTRNHVYTTDLGYLQTEFGVRGTPLTIIPSLKEIPLYVRAVATLGFGLSTTFDQREEIVSPQGVLYPETNTTDREVASGNISDVEPLMSGGMGIGYDLRLTPRLSIAPEIAYYYGFGNVTLNRDWTISALQGGLAARWRFGPKVKPPPAPMPIVEAPSHTPPPPPAKVTPPTARLAVTSPAKLSIVRTVVTETFPILPYVFFDSGATSIPRRYRQLNPISREGFDPEELSWESLNAYYDLLNVVGYRMLGDESLQISVNGTTDGKEETVPGARQNLARGRAAAVKKYLVDSWGIDPARIEVTTSERPEYPSSSEYPEGLEENRRVEIRSNRPEVLQPIVHERFNEYSYEPTNIDLALDGSSNKGISSWRVLVRANEKEALGLAGEGPPPANLALRLTQESAGKISDALHDGGEVQAELIVRDGEGNLAKERAGIPTQIEHNPFEISRLSLIVFDFDKSEITRQNRGLVESFVSEALRDGSTLSIVGTTDRLGDPAHNKELSEHRARKVETIIRESTPEATITNVEGVGERRRYDNDLPEGRYYCRTVTVEVKTPIETMREGL